MDRNVASQKLVIYVFDSATGLPKTGDAANITPYISLDGGTPAVPATPTATEMDATHMPGYYSVALAQAETNCKDLYSGGKSTTSGIVVRPETHDMKPANFTSMVIDSTGNVKIQAGLKTNQTLTNYEFVMTDSTTHNPVTGKTVTVTRSIDGGALAAGTVGAVTELSNGIYYVTVPAADMNGKVVTLRMTASGCDDLFVTFLTEP